jgi:hypothetical protein
MSELPLDVVNQQNCDAESNCSNQALWRTTEVIVESDERDVKGRLEKRLGEDVPASLRITH